VTVGNAAADPATNLVVTTPMPAGASDRALILRDDLTPPAGAPVPPPLGRSFGVFFLAATDTAGRAVHQFGQPLTITLNYTREQLQARGIGEHDLALQWFDPAPVITQTDGTVTTGGWMTVPTTVDPAAQTATAVVAHFTDFQFADGSSPSEAFIPSLQSFQVSTFTDATTYTWAPRRTRRGVSTPSRSGARRPASGSWCASTPSATTTACCPMRWSARAARPGRSSAATRRTPS